MALIPNILFCQSDDCTQLQVTDNTGKFDATDNPGGWGNPNVELVNTTSAVLKTLLPGGTSGADEIIIDLQPQIPNDSFQFKILKSQDFGLTVDTLLPDGTYIFDYEVTNSVGPVTFTYHTEVTLVCQKAKCVNDLLAKIAATGCDCSREVRDLANDAFTVLQAIKHGAVCQRPTEVAENFKLLDKLCKQIENCLLFD